jgi:rod shape-determining protein MreD
MSYLIILLLGMVSALLQSTLLRTLFPQTFVPDILLLLVLYGSLLFPFGKGLLLAFALGLCSDLFSGAPEGLNALFSITLFVTSKAIQARFFMKGFRAIWGLTILAFALKVPYYALLSVLFGLHFPKAADGALIWVGEFVSSLLLMPVLFYVVSKALGFQGGCFPQHQGSNPA